MLALARRADWLLAASLVPFTHWVTQGALASSTLAAGRIALAAEDLGGPFGLVRTAVAAA